MPRRIEQDDYFQKGDTLTMIRSAITLLSGGLDSVTLAYDYANRGFTMHLLSFDYGQRHHKELDAAGRIADRMSLPHHIVQLRAQTDRDRLHGVADPLATVLGPSSLVSDTPVPDGHYAEESMRQTVVPNRNAIMLSIAYGVAVAEEADTVAFAAHSGDHAIYPDCRPEFVQALGGALASGNRWKTEDVPRIVAPYLAKTKGDIAVLAHHLGVPIAETWSCYKGGEIHCGTCGTCVERREALEHARVVTGKADPTRYLDSTTMFQAPR